MEKKSRKRVEMSSAKVMFFMVILTLISKALGFIREMVLAAFYGTSYVVDAFVMAQSIPNIILGGVFVAISTAYMPLYSKQSEKEGKEAGNILTTQVLMILMTISLIATFIGIGLSDWLIKIFASGFEGESLEMASFFLKVTFSYTLFTSIAGIYKSFLEYKKIFLPQIVIEYMQNISVIIMVVVSAKIDYRFLPFGLLFGYIFRWIMLSRLAQKKDFKYNLSVKGLGKTIKNILYLSLPVFLGTSIQEINVFVDRMLASNLESGSISALNYANQIVTIVISLTVTILTTVIYPKLVKMGTNNDRENFVKLIQKGFNIILIIALPVTIGGMLYNEEVISFIYQRGEFDEHAVFMTAGAFLFYALGIIFTSYNDYMTKIYYSLNSMKIPMIFAGICMFINIGLNLILVNYMQHLGLALGTSLAAASYTIMQIVYFNKKYRDYKLIESAKKVITIIIISIVSVLSVFCLYRFSLLWLSNFKVLLFLIAIIFTVLVYIILLYIFKIKEFIVVMEDFIRKSKSIGKK